MFKKSLLAFFIVIAYAAAIVSAAPIGQFSRPLSFHRLIRGLDNVNGAKHPRSPGLFSPPGFRLPTSHIHIGQPPADLPAISPGALSNAPAQPRDPEPEDEDWAVREIRSEVILIVKELAESGELPNSIIDLGLGDLGQGEEEVLEWLKNLRNRLKQSSEEEKERILYGLTELMEKVMERLEKSSEEKERILNGLKELMEEVEGRLEDPEVGEETDSNILNT